MERCRLSVGKHRGCLEDYILENTYIYKWCVRGVCMEDEELTNEQEDLILDRDRIEKEEQYGKSRTKL